MTHKYYFILAILAVSVITTRSFHVEERSKDDWKAQSRQYGEQCVNHDECVDYRMICNSVCQCDQFHDWTPLNSYVSECVVNSQRLREFLATQHETHPSFEEEVSNEAHNLFVYLGLTGIIALSIGVLFVLACIVFVFTNDINERTAEMKR